MILWHKAPIRCAHLSQGRGALSHQQSRLSFRKKTERGKRCWPHLWIHCLSQGGSGGHCRHPVDWVPPRTCFRQRQKARYASTCYHMPPWYRDPPPYLGGGGLRRCHVSKALDLSPPPRRAPTLPRAQRLWTPLAIQDGSNAATCPSAPDPALLIRRDLIVSHVYCSGPHLPQWWAPVLTHVPWLSAGHRDKKRLSCNDMR
jgi:hypothetical protein